MERQWIEKIWDIQSLIKNNKLKINNDLNRLLHKTIKKVGEDIEGFKLNTAVSSMMILVNSISKEKEINKDIYEKLLLILSPFAPHITEDIWNKLGNKKKLPFGNFGNFFI